MSLPFAGTTTTSRNGNYIVSIIQICSRDETLPRWMPLSTAELTQTIRYPIGIKYQFLIDIHEIKQPTGSLAYTHSSYIPPSFPYMTKTETHTYISKSHYTNRELQEYKKVDADTVPIITNIDVKYYAKSLKLCPSVGIISCDNIWCRNIGVIDRIDDVDVIFHIGDAIYADPIYTAWTKGSGIFNRKCIDNLLDAVAYLYIQTWNRFPMYKAEHRIIPDDHDWCDNSSLDKITCKTKHQYNYIRAITHFNDLLGFVINGHLRQSGSYYTASLQTQKTTYLAISNYVPNVELIPKVVTNSEIVRDLIQQNITLTTPEVVIIVSKTSFPITQTLMFNRLLYGHDSLCNWHNYKAFAILKRVWRTNLTVVCGDLHLPLAMNVQYCDPDGYTIQYPMYSTGTLSGVSEDHVKDDFDKPAGVTLVPIGQSHHCERGNSYLRVRGCQVEVIFRSQDALQFADAAYKFGACCI